MSGTGDKIRGKTEELAGKVTNNEELEAKGRGRQIAGDLKDKAEDVKDDAGDKVNDTLDGVQDRLGDDDDSHSK